MNVRSSAAKHFGPRASTDRSLSESPLPKGDEAQISSTKEDATLRRIVDTIAEALDPEQIVLFGSRSPSERREITATTTSVEGWSRTTTGVGSSGRPRPVRPPGFSVDALVLSPEELEEQKRLANTLGHIVARNGEVLHERS